MNDWPTSVADHEPGVQQSEPDRGNDQEVHRDDAMAVIAKEGPPPLALIMVRISLREISRDGGKADGNPKLLEFAPDLSGAPAVLS